MAVDPPVKTKVSVDPDTGARVFNQSWSSELKKKEPIQRKPVSRDTFVTEKKVVVNPEKKQSTVKTSGERNFSEVIKPSPAGVVEKKQTIEVKAPRLATPTEKEKRQITAIELKKKSFETKQDKLKALGIPTQTWEDNRKEWNKINERTPSEVNKIARQKEKERKNSFVSIGTGDGSEKQRNGGCTGGCH